MSFVASTTAPAAGTSNSPAQTTSRPIYHTYTTTGPPAVPAPFPGANHIVKLLASLAKAIACVCMHLKHDDPSAPHVRRPCVHAAVQPFWRHIPAMRCPLQFQSQFRVLKHEPCRAGTRWFAADRWFQMQSVCLCHCSTNAGEMASKH
jgi:hypothetical protein